MTVVPLFRQTLRHPQADVCTACDVRGSALFGAMDVESLGHIQTHIPGIELAADSSIFSRGMAAESVYTVRSGLVRFERFSERGDRRIVRLAGHGDLIGQEALLQRGYVDEAIACTPVQLCRIPRGLVDTLGDRESRLARELLHRLQRALDEAEAWMVDLSTGPARRRLLRLLARLSRYPAPDGTIWMPRRDEIGAMLDLTVETASRLISRLRREGVLELHGPRAARLDDAALSVALRAADAG